MGHPSPPPLTPELKRKVFAELLLRARALTKRHEAEFVVIRFPALYEVQPDPVQEVLRVLERTEDLNVLDFADDFRRAGPSGAYHFARDGHLNRRGHERVATVLSAYLAERTSFGRHVQQQVRPTTSTLTKP